MTASSTARSKGHLTRRLAQICRRKQAQREAAGTLSRASAFVAQLQTELAEAARCHAVMAEIFSEIGAREYPA
jgi:hypothetical protein